jgi:hypothetical protein
MWLDTTDLKDSTGAILVNISVGAILNDLERVYPAVKQFRTTPGLMRVILSPQETADFLFFLMSEMSTANASTTTRSMAIISYFIDAGWMPAMEPEQQTRLEERY